MPKTPAEMSHDELLLRLTAAAVRVLAEFGLHGREAVLPGVGLSAEDFAYAVFYDYLSGKIKTNNLSYLCEAVRNDVLDKVRLLSYRTTVSMSPALVGEADGDENGNTDPIAEFPDGKPLIDHVLCSQDFCEKVRACAGTDPKLKEYIEAILDCGYTKPAEIADVMGLPVDDVYVLRRKLERHLIKAGLTKVSR